MNNFRFRRTLHVESLRRFLLSCVYADCFICFQMRDLYAGLCLWGPHPVLAMYAHLPYGLYRWLAYEILHLPLLHGACGCCPALHLRDQLNFPSLLQPNRYIKHDPLQLPKPSSCPLIEWEELKEKKWKCWLLSCTLKVSHSPNVGLSYPWSDSRLSWS